MQLLYGQEIGKNDETTLDKRLHQQLSKTKQLFFVYLQYLIEIGQHSVVDASIKANKYIVNENEVVSTIISQNPILVAVSEHSAYQNILKKYNISSFIDAKWVKELYQQLVSTQKYVNYCEKKERNWDDEIDILRYILKKVIGASANLDDFLAEHFSNIEDDHFICIHSLQKKLKEVENNKLTNWIEDLIVDIEEKDEEVFANSLLNNYLTNLSVLEETIQPRLKNWDMERISMIDILLIKLAIVEFLYMPYIPLKVSLNEYIDISKEYSSEKSKEFINGILDKTMKILEKEGKIKKLGRGLINN